MDPSLAYKALRPFDLPANCTEQVTETTQGMHVAEQKQLY